MQLCYERRSDWHELVSRLVENEKTASRYVEIGPVEMKPALAFKRLDAGETAQVAQGDLDPDTFELGAQLGNAPARPRLKNLLPPLLQDRHPVRDELGF